MRYSIGSHLDAIDQTPVGSADDARAAAAALGRLRLRVEPADLEAALTRLSARSAGWIAADALLAEYEAARPQVLPTMRLLDRPPGLKRWLWHDLVRITGDMTLVLLHGREKQGKSWLVLAMVLSLASGLPLFGRWQPSPATARVLLLSPEGGSEIARERLWSLAKGLHMTDEEWARTDSNISYVDMDSCTVHLNKPDDAEELRNTIAATRADTLVLDPLVEFHTCDENDNGKMASLLSTLRGLSDRPLAVVLAHHNSKHGEEARGASAILGKYDFMVSIGQASAWRPTTTGAVRTVGLAFSARASIPPPPMILTLTSDEAGDRMDATVSEASEDKAGAGKRALVKAMGVRSLGKADIRRLLPGANEAKSTLLETLITDAWLVPDGIKWRIAPQYLTPITTPDGDADDAQ